MHGPTLRLLIAAIAATGALSYAAVADPPLVPVSALEAHVGHTVRVIGFVHDPWPRDGTTWFDLVADGHAVRARATGAVASGWMEVTGRIGHIDSIVLFVEHVSPAPPGTPPEVPLPMLAADPGRWADRHIAVAGTVERDVLRLDHVRIALGDGPWPREGAVRATGIMHADPLCACHRFHADHVTTWTP